MALLVLVRHGESMWNKENVFTGWVDVPLSEKGIEEALKAGEELADISFDVIYTSTLLRAITTMALIMSKNKSGKIPYVIHDRDGGKLVEWAKIYDEEMQKKMIPVYMRWELNERYYGELQGKNKDKTRQQFGEEQVKLWRRSYDVPPPNGESLEMTAKRTIPCFENEILPLLKEGKNVLIAAHGNSLRSIIMYLDNLSKEEVISLELKTGKPVYYEYKEGKLIKIEK